MLLLENGDDAVAPAADGAVEGPLGVPCRFTFNALGGRKKLGDMPTVSEVAERRCGLIF